MSVLPEIQKRLTEARTRIQSRLSEIKRRVPIFTRMGVAQHTPATPQGRFVQEVTSRIQNVMKAVEPLRPLNVAKRMSERLGLGIKIPSAPKIGAVTPTAQETPTTGGLGMRRKISGGL